MSVKIEIHDIDESGSCSLSGKSGEVLVVSFADGTVSESPLSQKSLMQLLRLKLGQKKAKPAEAKPAGNGAPAALPVLPK